MEGATGRENWKDVLPHRSDVLLEGIEVFKDYLVASERKGGLKQLRVIRWADRQEHYLDADEPTYTTNFDANPEFDSKTLRYGFSSLKTPYSVIDYDMETRKKEVKKVSPVLGGFSPDNYQTEFMWAKARDGVRVPMSILYKKGLGDYTAELC